MANRRKVLLTISACGVGSLAGCTSNTGDDESSSNTGNDESSADDDSDQENCISSPVEILSIDDDDPSDLTVSLQNQANAEARYTIEVAFSAYEPPSDKTERVSGTIGAKLNKNVRISGGLIEGISGEEERGSLYEPTDYEMTLNSECL